MQRFPVKTSLFFLLLFPCGLYAQNVSNITTQQTVETDTSAQKDLIDVAKSWFKIKPKEIKAERGKKIYFSILPVSSTVPGGSGRALVTSTTAAMYLGPRKTTNLSSVTFTPYWNLGNRFGLPLRSTIWLPDNKWVIQGDTRFLVYPQYTWGLGSKASNPAPTLVDYKYIRFYQSALKQVRPYFFAGLGYSLDYHFNIKTEDPNVSLKEYTNYQYGTGSNSFSSGVTFNLLYDTRNNSINPLPGMYGNLVYRVNPKFLGSNDSWSSLYLDVRKYISMNPSKPDQQNTLAFWTYLWASLGNKTPYLDLPSIGWDPANRSGRGIDQNRYRGRSLFYLESEYRRDITNNGLFGFVVFANVNTVSGSKAMFSSWKPAVGTGLRVKFNKSSNTNIGVDYGTSKGYNSFTFSLGETF